MKNSPLFLLAALVVSTASFAQTGTQADFRALHVDAGKVIGTIRSFQGVNGAPYPIMKGFPNLVQQYKELHIDIVRTHDSMGPTDIAAQYSLQNPLLTWLVPDSEQRSALVQAGNAAAIFPNWEADPEKPESYNFAPTDEVIQAIMASGAEVYFRIGRSFGADLTPLPDFDKFASVVRHTAMHYNQGWAKGFHDHIRYWEFWNEPDIFVFWNGAAQQLYTLYEKTVQALKSMDPSLLVGGDTVAFAMNEGPYREGFLDYCAAHQLSLDFFSWHTYADASADPYDAARIGREIRRLLDAKGFKKTRSILSEWNLSADFTDPEKPVLQGMQNAAFIGAAMIYLQDSPVDRAEFYRADAVWMGLFGMQGEYFKPAYTFRATGAMLATPERLRVTGTDTFGLAALAGRSRDGKTVQVLISNYERPAGFKPHMMDLPPELKKAAGQIDFSKVKMLTPRTDIAYRQNRGYELTIRNLPWGSDAFKVKRYRLTEKQDLALEGETSGSGGRLEMANPLPPPGLELLVLSRTK